MLGAGNRLKDSEMIQWQTESERAVQTVASPSIPTISFLCRAPPICTRSFSLTVSLKHLKPPKIDAFQESKCHIVLLTSTHFSRFMLINVQSFVHFVDVYKTRHYSLLIIVCFALDLHPSFHHGSLVVCVWITVHTHAVPGK